MGISLERAYAYHREHGHKLTEKEAAVLAVLADGARHSREELEAVGGSRAPARVWDLHKKYGYEYDWEENPKGSGLTWYWLTGKRPAPVDDSKR